MNARSEIILVFGGTFDPPHQAHVALPRLALQKIGASKVAYVPAALNPLKASQPFTSAAHRLAMLRLALADQPHAVIWTDELDRAAAEHAASPSRAPEPSYTVDTLRRLKQRLGPGVKLRLLLGGDNLRSFDRWREPQEIIRLAEPLVMVRPPDSAAQLLRELPRGFDPKEWEPRILPLPTLPESSTLVRQLIAAGQSIDPLVGPAVAKYIHEHGLYRSGQVTPENTEGTE